MGKFKYSMEDWRAVRNALDAGGTIRGTAAETGVNRGAVHRWSLSGEPPEWVWLEMEIAQDGAAAARAGSPKARLTYEDRCMVFAMRDAWRTHAKACDDLDWLHLTGHFREGLRYARKEVPAWQIPSIPGSSARSSSAR